MYSTRRNKSGVPSEVSPVFSGAPLKSVHPSTRTYQQTVALCLFSGKVNWPVCTEEDKRIGWSDIVLNQPPASVAKHTD